MLSKGIKKKLPGFIPSAYYPSSNFLQSGNIYILKPDDGYAALFTYDKTKLMQHHQPNAYQYLINALLNTQNLN